MEILIEREIHEDRKREIYIHGDRKRERERYMELERYIYIYTWRLKDIYT